MSRVPRWLRPGTFIRSVSLLAGGTALGQIITIAVSPVLTRLFDAEAFGILAVYTAVLGVTTAVGSLRLEQAIGLPRGKQAGFTVLVLAVLASLFTSMIVGLIVMVAPQLLFQQGQNVPALILWLFPLGVILSSLYQALSVWALRLREFRPIAATKITQAATAAGVQIAAGMAGIGSIGLVAGSMIGQSAGISTLIARTMRGKSLRRPRRRELIATFARYRNFPLLATPAALLNALAFQLPVLLMAPTFGAAVVGQYFLATRIALAPLTLIGGSIGQVFYADAVAISRNNPTKLLRLVLSTSAKSFLIGIIPGVAIYALSPWLFPVIFGDEWSSAGQMSQALAVMLVANFAMSPVTQIFLILERQWLSIVINAVRLIVAAVAILTPAYLGNTAEYTVMIYSWTMAAFYFATLLVAVLLLTSSARRNN
ncbi:oligosaccharide flippase family protein [Microbacterium sp. AGC62]